MDNEIMKNYEAIEKRAAEAESRVLTCLKDFYLAALDKLHFLRMYYECYEYMDDSADNGTEKKIVDLDSRIDYISKKLTILNSSEPIDDAELQRMLDEVDSL